MANTWLDSNKKVEGLEGKPGIQVFCYVLFTGFCACLQRMRVGQTHSDACRDHTSAPGRGSRPGVVTQQGRVRTGAS